MSTARYLRCGVAALILSFVAFGSIAQDKAAAPFTPKIGQAGKDVIWVPTPQPLVDHMLSLAKLTRKDYLIDLGSGDGRTVITAAKRGARALGVEYNPKMVALAKRLAAEAGVGDKAQFVRGDIFKTDFSAATVITLFLLPELNLKLRPKILDMRPGTRVVSNSFTMDDWQADESARATMAEGCESYCTAFLWIVPAKVEGTWHMSDGQLKLEQRFQMVAGSLRIDGRTSRIGGGRLRGNVIWFNAGGVVYTGRVHGDSIEGQADDGRRVRHWRATRHLRS